ncbi:GNAT family N-acetyltransferase [Amycolatopsis sp. NPDC059021]|uniref:GNAT family N-acetyltransferase n=1 Tax=Amycolatopsis sp. NPDC059021 TaxID=3346704 RepID=UPI0036735DE5
MTAAYEVRVSDRLDVDESAWAGLRYPEPPHTTAYLSAIAAADLDCAFRFFTMRRNGILVAAAYGCLVDYPVLGPLHVPVFVGGSPVNLGPPFYFASADIAVEALEVLASAVLDEAAAMRAKVVLLRDFWEPGPDEVCGDPLRALGFRRTTVFADAVLTVDWPDFDGYLASLPAKTRKGLRRDARQVVAAGYRVEIHRDPLPADKLATMQRLWNNLYEKYRDPDQIFLTTDYFRRVTALPETVVLLAHHGETLVGFDLLLARHGTLESTYSGLDHDQVGKVSLHRHMGQQIIRFAISGGFRTVDFGISNEAAKARVGCRFRVSRGYLRPLSRLWRGLRVDRLMFPEPDLPARLPRMRVTADPAAVARP